MAHLFTYQDFADGVIGLAYVGNPKRNAVGGICTESNYKLYSSISSVATSNFPSFIPAHLRPVPPPHHATPSLQYTLLSSREAFFKHKDLLILLFMQLRTFLV